MRCARCKTLTGIVAVLFQYLLGADYPPEEAVAEKQSDAPPLEPHMEVGRSITDGPNAEQKVLNDLAESRK